VLQPLTSFENSLKWATGGNGGFNSHREWELRQQGTEFEREENTQMHHPSTKKNSSLRELKHAIEEIRDPEDKSIAEHMLVVMKALEVGVNVNRLVTRTGYTRDFIESISVRMREAGLWVGELVDDREWWDHRSEELWRIFRHGLVAQGTLNRVSNPNGGCTYLDAEMGEVSGEWNPPSRTVSHQPN
jgi:hypothetical protein